MNGQPSDSAHDQPRSQKVEAAAALQARLIELQQQFDVLKTQVRQAQQLSTLGTAAAVIAHEVNNLLTPIVSFVRPALTSDDDRLKEKALQVTLKNVEILISMSERILELGAARPPSRENVRVRAVIDDALSSLCRDLSKDGIQLIVDVDPALTVCADRLQVQQVFFNLFLNAREAMASRHGGVLKVTAAGVHSSAQPSRNRPPLPSRRHALDVAERCQGDVKGQGAFSSGTLAPGEPSRDRLSFTSRSDVKDQEAVSNANDTNPWRQEQVVIEVSSSGEGIPPDVLPHLFEPFQTSKPVTRGGQTRCGGLGLSLCRDLIEENEGTITASSRIGQGTTFTIVLPRGG